MKKEENIFIKLFKKLKKKIDYQMWVEEAGRVAPMNAYGGKTREEFWGGKKRKKNKACGEI